MEQQQQQSSVNGAVLDPDGGGGCGDQGDEDSSSGDDDIDIKLCEYSSDKRLSKSLPTFPLNYNNNTKNTTTTIITLEQYQTEKSLKKNFHIFSQVRQNHKTNDSPKKFAHQPSKMIVQNHLNHRNSNSNNSSGKSKQQKRRDAEHRFRVKNKGNFSHRPDCDEMNRRMYWRTLQQHYYPEGGYGWVIMSSAVLSHIIAHGVQISMTSMTPLFTHFQTGWGWIVVVCALFSHVLMCGVQLSAGLIVSAICRQFGADEVRVEAGWMGACSVGISLFLSPLWVSICKRKSTRLTAVFGGLVAALGCLFTSFATQLHQIFFSYATILGVGVGLTRDASSLMVGQYFKRKRDMVEIIVVAASGLGILIMSILINGAINSLGWRLGLQVVTGCLFICFFLGTCYRSASLYHPQRRAILHLKNQKRKVKDKEKRDDKPPFLDCSCLRSKTVQILLLSSALAAFGSYTPIFYLAIDHHKDDPSSSDVDVSLLYIYVGLAWMMGCFVFGILVIQKSKECRMSKQYLCQAAGIICGISIQLLTIVKGQSGLLIFCCIYGFSLGGYNYALKVYTYERVRARHFPRAWSFIQSSQGIPLFIGVPITGYLNDTFPGWRAGYYLSALSVVLGSTFLFLADVRKRRLSRRKSQMSSTKTSDTTVTIDKGSSSTTSMSKKVGRLSFAFPVEQQQQISQENAENFSKKLQPQNENLVDDEHENEEEEDDALDHDDDDGSVLVKELTCISEEAFAEDMANMDFQNIYYEEWDDLIGKSGECISRSARGGLITSSSAAATTAGKSKVEDCLVSSFQPDCPKSAVATATTTILDGPQRKYPKFSNPNLNPTQHPAEIFVDSETANRRLPISIQKTTPLNDDDSSRRSNVMSPSKLSSSSSSPSSSIIPPLLSPSSLSSMGQCDESVL